MSLLNTITSLFGDNQETTLLNDYNSTVDTIQKQSLFQQVQDNFSQLNHSAKDTQHFNNAINAMGLLLSNGGLSDGVHSLMMYDHTIDVTFYKGKCVDMKTISHGSN